MVDKRREPVCAAFCAVGDAGCGQEPVVGQDPRNSRATVVRDAWPRILKTLQPKQSADRFRQKGPAARNPAPWVNPHSYRVRRTMSDLGNAATTLCRPHGGDCPVFFKQKTAYEI